MGHVEEVKICCCLAVCFMVDYMNERKSSILWDRSLYLANCPGVPWKSCREFFWEKIPFDQLNSWLSRDWRGFFNKYVWWRWVVGEFLSQDVGTILIFYNCQRWDLANFGIFSRISNFFRNILFRRLTWFSLKKIKLVGRVDEESEEWLLIGFQRKATGGFSNFFLASAKMISVTLLFWSRRAPSVSRYSRFQASAAMSSRAWWSSPYAWMAFTMIRASSCSAERPFL